MVATQSRRRRAVGAVKQVVDGENGGFHLAVDVGKNEFQAPKVMRRVALVVVVVVVVGGGGGTRRGRRRCPSSSSVVVAVFVWRGRRMFVVGCVLARELGPRFGSVRFVGVVITGSKQASTQARTDGRTHARGKQEQ